MTRRTRRTTLTFLTACLLLVAAPAWACGFLIAENGAVRLVRTATLVAWEDGVEHYVTSFEFQGGGAAFGSIIPLPGEPTKVEKGGSWTLQRLGRETQPELRAGSEAVLAAEDAGGAEVLQEVQVDALDITVLKGGGQGVLDWANENGFDLPADAADMLEFYAARSPYFMASRFDVDRAAEFEQGIGDGTPVHLEIPTKDPWVPLAILGYAKPANEIVEADVYLLTPDVPTLLPEGRKGLEVRYQEPASDLLLDDLRSDENSSWIPEEAVLTHVRLDVPAGDLVYDLAIDVDGESPSAVAAFGARQTFTDEVVGTVEAAAPTEPTMDWGLIALIAALVGVAVAGTAVAVRD